MLLDGDFHGFENETDAQDNYLTPGNRQIRNEQNTTSNKAESR
jgi:hypothetical protein